MKKINLLDCTLRDGGYVNNWNFGKSNILYLFNKLVLSGVEIIEIGFLDDRVPFDINRTIQPNTKCFDKIFCNVDKKNAFVVAMIDYGTCSIENIEKEEDSFIDGIRIIFKKPKMEEAINFAQQVMQKGYKVSLQMVSITDYKDYDILDFSKKVNKISPFAVSIVDTYGLMHKEEVLDYVYLLNRNLDKNISIAYHSHNNFQLAYSNCVELIKRNIDRNIIVDGTIYGMGKSAGNAPIELLMMHLNEKYNCRYDLNQVLEAIDVCIINIYNKHYWGYSMEYFVAASNDCHPNYVKYLIKKKTLSISSINNILKKIDARKRLSYDENHIEFLYDEYQKEIKCDNALYINKLNNLLNDKKILVIGPGKSIDTEQDKIKEFIGSIKPFVISVNCYPKIFNVDMIFFSSSKRYEMLFSELSNLSIGKIFTSNIDCQNISNKYVIGYDKLEEDNDIIKDNALVMFLNLMKIINKNKIFLAGFDGFSLEDNYYDGYMALEKDKGTIVNINNCVKSKINNLRKDMEIEFLTNSIYD